LVFRERSRQTNVMKEKGLGCSEVVGERNYSTSGGK
jgi:hypothetical protein